MKQKKNVNPFHLETLTLDVMMLRNQNKCLCVRIQIRNFIDTTKFTEIASKTVCDTDLVDGVVIIAGVPFSDQPLGGLIIDIESRFIYESIIIQKVLIRNTPFFSSLFTIGKSYFIISQLKRTYLFKRKIAIGFQKVSKIIFF